MNIDCKRLSINGMMRLPIKQGIFYQQAGNMCMLENEPCAALYFILVHETARLFNERL